MNQVRQTQDKYLSTVSALTVKSVNATAVAEDVPAAETTQMSASLMLTPFLLFFGLFIVAIAIQIVQRALTIRRMMSAMAVALIVACTPFAARLLYQRNANPYLKANISEVPRNASVILRGSVVYIRWSTDKPVTGAVRIIPPGQSGRPVTIVGNNGSVVVEHTVSVPASEPGIYMLEILSGDKWYDDHGRPVTITVPRL